MTEQEAKTKWCPFTRLAEHGAPRTVANRFVEAESDWGVTTCLGSSCMTWRWSFLVDENGGLIRSNETDTPTGYCGLAPQS